MTVGKLDVQINMDTKRMMDIIENIANILQPYDLSDEDIDRISELLKSCLKVENNEITNEDKLLPCPFCGDIVTEITDDYNSFRFTINCTNCGLQMFDISHKNLIVNWNTRFENKEIDK